MLAKINYRRLSGPVCKRHPFSRGIGIPRTRSRILPAAVPRRSYNARPSPTQNKFAAIFLFRAPHIHISRRFSFRGGACSAPRKRRREAAVGWSVRFLDVGPRLVNGMRRDGTRDWEEGGGKLVGGRPGGVSRWTRRHGRFQGSLAIFSPRV